MRLMITDSGLGGLSVCAGIEAALVQRSYGGDIELLYVNATPDDRIGYNALKTQAERIQLFDRFLKASSARYKPDQIIIACNTLSVIYDQTSFAASTRIHVRGIVEAGVELCEGNLAQEPDRDLIVFATETTTEANTYPDKIKTSQARIIPQACPELAHAISNDASGQLSRTLIKDYARAAVQHTHPDTNKLFAFLGCTHYGYQAQLFVEALANEGYEALTLDPNHLLVEKLVNELDALPTKQALNLSARFISRYPIPLAEISSMAVYLQENAVLTLSALRNHSVVPDLFEIP